MSKSLQLELPIRSVWRNLIHFLAFGFGSGTLPWMPGTWGTLAAIPLYLLLAPLSLWLYSVILLVFIVLGVYWCGVAERDIGIKDYPGIVWDEIAGYLLTMLAAPQGWIWVVIGFILFRIFDIAKPWLISWVNRYVKGGLGVMLDDLLAAVPSWLILQGLAKWVIH